MKALSELPIPRSAEWIAFHHLAYTIANGSLFMIPVSCLAHGFLDEPVTVNLPWYLVALEALTIYIGIFASPLAFGVYRSANILQKRAFSSEPKSCAKRAAVLFAMLGIVFVAAIIILTRELSDAAPLLLLLLLQTAVFRGLTLLALKKLKPPVAAGGFPVIVQAPEINCR